MGRKPTNCITGQTREIYKCRYGGNWEPYKLSSTSFLLYNFMGLNMFCRVLRDLKLWFHPVSRDRPCTNHPDTNDGSNIPHTPKVSGSYVIGLCWGPMADTVQYKEFQDYVRLFQKTTNQLKPQKTHKIIILHWFKWTQTFRRYFDRTAYF